MNGRPLQTVFNREVPLKFVSENQSGSSKHVIHALGSVPSDARMFCGTSLSALSRLPRKLIRQISVMGPRNSDPSAQLGGPLKAHLQA